MTTSTRLLVCVIIGVTMSGCAKKRVIPLPPRPVVIDLAPADALFQAGCYRCLSEANALYARALASPEAPAGARRGVFATSILLALREKELDLEATPWLERALAVATPDEAPYLDVAAAMPWDGGSTPDFAPQDSLSSQTLVQWRASMPLRRHPQLDDYILLSLECKIGRRPTFDDAVRTIDLSSPLLQYGAGICHPDQRPLLEQLVEQEPRFVEAYYFIGRYEMATGVIAPGQGGSALQSIASRRWLVTAVKPLRQAHEALPEVPTITSVFAGVMRARNELRRALALYDEALAIRPGHGEALFGRTITLSYLRRYDEGMAAATEIIRRNRGHVSSAFYYRAWNAYQKTQLPEAARDIAIAKQMRAPEEVLVLSGIVAYDQKRAADARRDFDAAIEENSTRCTGHWYLGILNLDEQSWRPAVSRFATSAQCYLTAAGAFQMEARQLPPDLPEDIRAEQVASIDQNIAESMKQAGRSLYNAAQAAMQAGDSPTALLYARQALAYEVVRERADMIVKRLER